MLICYLLYLNPPYAIARGESVADFTNTLLRGTTLEGVIDNIKEMKIK